jgi:hypothetical protein
MPAIYGLLTLLDKKFGIGTDFVKHLRSRFNLGDDPVQNISNLAGLGAMRFAPAMGLARGVGELISGPRETLEEVPLTGDEDEDEEKKAASVKQQNMKLLAGLMKRAKVEKRAGWAQLAPLMLAFGRPLMGILGKGGRMAGRVLGSPKLMKLFGRAPMRLVRNIGKGLQYGGRGIGHALSGIGAKGMGGRILSSLKSPGTHGALRQASSLGNRLLGLGETLSYASMFLPPSMLPSFLDPYSGEEGYGMPDMQMPGQQWGQMQQAAANKGYMLPPNRYLQAMQGGQGPVQEF